VLTIRLARRAPFLIVGWLWYSERLFLSSAYPVETRRWRTGTPTFHLWVCCCASVGLVDLAKGVRSAPMSWPPRLSFRSWRLFRDRVQSPFG